MLSAITSSSLYAFATHTSSCGVGVKAAIADAKATVSGEYVEYVKYIFHYHGTPVPLTGFLLSSI